MSPARRILRVVGLVLAAVLACWALAALSAWITRQHLTHEADRQYALIHAGQPLWQWPLRTRHDVVARRIFGPADLAATPQGLALTSRDGSPFEIGLPVDAPMDLAHWPLLALDGDAQGMLLGLIYQAGPDAPTCRSKPQPWHGDAIDLRVLPWHDDNGAPCPAPGTVAYLWRLQWTLPAGSTIHLRYAALLAPGAIVDDQAAPRVALPANMQAERLLQLRDAALQAHPGALIAPADWQPASVSPENAWPDPALCAIYLILLTFITFRPVSPWLDAIIIAIGPLWLIAGLRWGSPHPAPALTAFVAALVFGGVGEWRRRPATWHWLGIAWRDWLWPLAPLLLAIALIAADGHAPVRLDPRHVLTYLGWAALQQWVMLVLVLLRLRRADWPRPLVILLTAVVFALLHTPNGSLMQLCFIAELWWAWCFLRAPRLLPIALAHATTALLLESTLAGGLWLRCLEVGARFFL